ncbi:MAG: hypothetical protein FJ030_05555 [Chloroflexi bacterium]|nr:hypothetical protein [Chloroflexota bacterium]
MTTKDDFTPEEWELIRKTLHEPGAAVMIAAPGGMIREVLAVAKGMSESAEMFAGSELIQSILRDTGSGEKRPAESSEASEAEHKPPRGEFIDVVIANLRRAVMIVAAKATAQELEDYKKFVLFLAEKVAKASSEGGFLGGGEPVTQAEQRVLDEIKLALRRKS